MELEPLWRVLLAAALATPVGLERELRGKAAGLRTHVVVAVAGAALGHVSLLVVPPDSPGGDPSRIASQVVAGIGFIGAGVIFGAGGRVHGLTTAAALWSASAIGLSVGLGQPSVAIALVAVTMVFLAPVDWLSQRLMDRFGVHERTFHIVAADLEGVSRAQAVIAQAGATTRQVALTSLGDHVAVQLQVSCRVNQVRTINDHLSQLHGVSFVSDEAYVAEES